jgi:Ca2+-transporting ATPase
VRRDVLQVAAGDVVGADARLVTSVLLQVDEALLTGESQPSSRDSTATSVDLATMADQS